MITSLQKRIEKSRVSKVAHHRIDQIVRSRKPLIFDHLPKCGGSTVNNYVKAVYTSKYTFAIKGSAKSQSIRTFQSWPRQKRHSMKLVYGHNANQLFDDVNPDAIRATVIREPVDRIVSHYYYVMRNKQHPLHKIVTENEIPLSEYCSHGLSDELENWYVSHFSGLRRVDVNRSPQNAVNKAVNNLFETYDVIGFQDDIASFINQVRSVVGIGKPYRGKKMNVTNQRKPLAEIEKDVIHKIQEKNQLDIQFYQRIREIIHS